MAISSIATVTPTSRPRVTICTKQIAPVQHPPGEFVFPSLLPIVQISRSSHCRKFGKSLVYSKAAAAIVFKNANIGSYLDCITKPFIIKMDPLFLIRIRNSISKQ